MELIKITKENIDREHICCAISNDKDLQTVLIDSKEKAQGAPAAVTSFSLFYNGSFMTHEILSIKKFETLVTELTKGGNGYED